MYLIEKSAGEATNFVEVFVNGPIGHEREEAEQLAKDITAAMMLIDLLKSTNIRMLTPTHLPRKLYWADDTRQWEVYSFEDRQVVWHYKGDNLLSAMEALGVSSI